MSKEVLDLVKAATTAERKARQSKDPVALWDAARAYRDAAMKAQDVAWALDPRIPVRQGGTSEADKAESKRLLALAEDLGKSAKIVDHEGHKALVKEHVAKEPERWAEHEKKVAAAVRRAKAVGARAEKAGTAEAYLAAEKAFDEARILAWQGKMFGRKLSSDIAMEMSAKATAMKAKIEELRRAAYQARHARWSERETLVAGQPPSSMNVLDEHGGFTAETKTRYGSPNTLWRPGALLKKGTIGTLVSSNPKSFFQTNNDVTKALYKVAGYPNPVAIWFDNATGRRIA